MKVIYCGNYDTIQVNIALSCRVLVVRTKKRHTCIIAMSVCPSVCLSVHPFRLLTRLSLWAHVPFILKAPVRESLSLKQDDARENHLDTFRQAIHLLSRKTL